MGLWIDTDMGFDDLAAVLVIINEGVAIDGMSLVFGNATMDHVAANAGRAAAAFGWPFALARGRAASVLGATQTAERVLGPTGILTAGARLPDAPPIETADAFTALCSWLEADPVGAKERHVLALGPLTNLAALALSRPELAARITALTWMGGGVTGGNHTPFAEFNAYADPEAVAIVLAHGIPLKLVDLDLGRTVCVAPHHVPLVREAGGRHAAALADMLQGFLEIALSRGRPAMALYDPAAAVAVVAPHLVSFARAQITVELREEAARGQTRVTFGDGKSAVEGANADVAVAVDAEAARDLILRALVNAAAVR